MKVFKILASCCVRAGSCVVRRVAGFAVARTTRVRAGTFTRRENRDPSEGASKTASRRS